jgi:hypothetical protein
MTNFQRLLNDVEQILITKAPLVEFESTSNEQIILSPTFQHRILDALLDLIDKHNADVKVILEDNSHLISFTTMFVNFYRLKQLDGSSND